MLLPYLVKYDSWPGSLIKAVIEYTLLGHPYLKRSVPTTITTPSRVLHDVFRMNDNLPIKTDGG